LSIVLEVKLRFLFECLIWHDKIILYDKFILWRDLKIPKGLEPMICRIITHFPFDLKRNRFFWKNLVIILSVAWLSIAFMGMINYFIGSRQIKSEVKRTHILQLKHAYNNIDRQMVQLESVIAQWAFNPIFSLDIRTTDLGVNFIRYNEILGGLKIIKGSNPLINDVWLYIDNIYGETLLSTEEGRRYVDKDEVKIFRNLLSGRRLNLFWVYPPVVGKDKRVASVVLIQKVPGGIGAPYGLLMVYLNKEAIYDIIGQMNIGNEGVSLILDQDGGWVTAGSSESQAESSVLNNLLRRKILTRPDDAGSFTLKYNKIFYQISYETLSKNGWKFVVATPINRLMAPVLTTSRLLMICGLIVGLIAVGFSFLASWNIYNPIRRLLGVINEEPQQTMDRASRDEIKYLEDRWNDIYRERKHLREKLEQNREFLNKSFLLQLIQGDIYNVSNGSEEDLQEQFRQYWWEPQDRMFAIFTVRLIHCNESEIMVPNDNGQLVTFAAVGIVEELLKKIIPESAVISFHDLSLAVLVSFFSARQKEELKFVLLHVAERIIQALTALLDAKLTICIGRLTGNLTELSHIMDENRQAMRYRDVNKNEEIIDVETLIPNVGSKFNYPLTIEKNIINAMKLGMESEAVTELTKFLEKVKKTAKNEHLLQQSILQLLGSILHLFVKTGINPEVICPGINLYEELGNLEPGDISKWFKKNIIKPFIREIVAAREYQTENSIKKILEIIANNYHTPISLESCADAVGMTPYCISREFKNYTGVNFIDYLTRVRLDKAEELLHSTFLTINEIAGRVGYQPNYFLRIFKKVEGVTPGQYRETALKGGLK
jgi:AraC-like DNA-binding protein